MRRLAIIDIADGKQPMSTEDGRFSIVFNGEIFNAAVLRQELEVTGVRFVTDHSDTEVLLRLLANQGIAALPRLNGMFAFALWDKLTQELLCVRDRFGIKPLYYVHQDNRFAFASELKSVLGLSWVSRDVDRRSLYHYMSLMYVPAERTAISGVCRLPPGSWMKLKLAEGTVEQGKWWVPKIGQGISMSREEASQRIRLALEDSVATWSNSDVPIGCSLSGGLDSSAIVGLLACKGRKLRTFSVGFSGRGEEDWNELPLARLVAKRWGTEHEEIILNPERILDDLMEMVWHLDEPYGGGLPSWAVFKQMSGKVKVAMTGTGGDELFGNYGKWRELEGGWLRRRLPSSAVTTDQFRKQFFDRYYYISDHLKHESVFQDCPMDYDTAAWMYRDIFNHSNKVNVRDRCAAVDIETQLPEEFLMMTDRFSMAHSVEARTPFLDHRLAELVLGFPAELRTRRGDLKYLLRLSIADLLPPELVNAPKRGFVIPLTLWLRGALRPLVENLLSPRRLAAQGLFKPEFYARYVRPHIDGKADFTKILWAVLMFQLWHLIFIEGRGVRPNSRVQDIVG
jgi:asparagine synthase (glutamine-hydrolysing)